MSRTLTAPVRVTIAQLMWVVAGVAFACAAPIWLLAIPLIILITALAIAIGTNRRVSLVQASLFTTSVGCLIALTLPMLVGAKRSNCIRHSPSTINSFPFAVFTIVGPETIARLTTDGQEKARPMWSPDGKTLTFARHEGGGSHIWQHMMNVDDPKSTKRLTERKPPEFHAAFLPDGKKLLIATVEQSGTQGNVDIAVIGSDGSGLKKIVGDLSGKLSHQDWPSPSPDASRFAFSSTHEGNQEIYAGKIDGTDVVRLTQSPGHDAHPNWSPKGDVVAFTTDRWGGLEIATVKPDGTGLLRLTKSPGIDDFPAISPDGSRIAFVSHRDGNAEIYVMDADGSNTINLSNHPRRDTQPTWTPDGLGITFVSDRDGACDLYTLAVPSK